MNQNKKAIILLSAVFLIFAILLIFVVLSSKTNKVNNLKNNSPVMNELTKQAENKEMEIKDSASNQKPEGEDEGEVFDGVLIKKEAGKLLMKKNNTGEELVFSVSSEAKLMQMELALKNEKTNETEFKGNKEIELIEIKEGDSLSIVAKKSTEEDGVYIVNEVKKVILLPIN